MEPLGYTPPPQTIAPPAGWSTPRVVQPAAPRSLPSQDHAAIDADEERARRLTHAMGVIAGVVLAALMATICARTLF